MASMRTLGLVFLALTWLANQGCVGASGSPSLANAGQLASLAGASGANLPSSAFSQVANTAGGNPSNQDAADAVGSSSQDGEEDGLPGDDASEAPETASGREGHAVVLVHGLGMGGFSMMGMQAYLQGQGIPEVHTVDLPSGGTANTMEDCAATLEGLIGQLAARGIDKVDLVGHSMGGLVIREYVRAYGTSSVAVPTLITVATPNHGNGTVASLLEKIGQKSAISQMAANSDFLARLNASPLPAGTKGYGLRTPNDMIVRRNESCLLPGGQNYSVDVGPVGAHVSMGFHPKSLKLIHALLTGNPPAANS